MSPRRHVLKGVLPLLFISACGVRAQDAAIPPGGPISTWSNTGDAPMPVDASRPPENALFVLTGRDGRPYRILYPRAVGSNLRVDVPPKATVQLWDAETFAAAPNNPFATAARWQAVPRIVVGPPLPPSDEKGPSPRMPVWSPASGEFRAFPEAGIPVTVYVRNTGIGAWNRPRVRLFAPDNWSVTPEVADVISPALKGPSEDAPSITEGSSGVLPPTMTGKATFLVRIPKGTVMGSAAPLVAFLRFDAARQPITVQNSVDVTIMEPIERRYAMNEAGDKFIVHLMNRFAPLMLGTPTVEVRQPAGTEWSITPPQPVEVGRDVDAVAPVAMTDADRVSAGQVAVPVVVTLNGLRMGYTPVVRVAARYGASVADKGVEEGLSARRDVAPVEFTDAGLCPAPGSTQRRFAFDVNDRFAVSDPKGFLSPSWVTVAFQNRGANRIRLEYNAWGTDAPTVAADQPLAVHAGVHHLTFLLPDARFQNVLPDHADLVLSTFGGDICLESITVSKWKAR